MSRIGKLLLGLAGAVVVVGLSWWLSPETPDNPQVFTVGLFDPTEEDIDLPRGYRESLDRDQLFPIYEPTFLEAAAVQWRGSDLVIGVEINGDARAYPVGILGLREIVIDTHQGIPTMVTW